MANWLQCVIKIVERDNQTQYCHIMPSAFSEHLLRGLERTFWRQPPDGTRLYPQTIGSSHQTKTSFGICILERRHVYAKMFVWNTRNPIYCGRRQRQWLPLSTCPGFENSLTQESAIRVLISGGMHHGSTKGGAKDQILFFRVLFEQVANQYERYQQLHGLTASSTPDKLSSKRTVDVSDGRMRLRCSFGLNVTWVKVSNGSSLI